jgi:hypothetical protein
MAALDEVLPVYRHRERHQRTVAAPRRRCGELVIRAGSGLIRRDLLRAVARRAESALLNQPD